MVQLFEFLELSMVLNAMCTLNVNICLEQTWGMVRTLIDGGVDVNSEVPEHSRKYFEMTFFDDFRKISCFFLREILNDLFWPVTNECRNAHYKAFRLIR